jgi:endonuclease/exonuclease/phosphatase (EEP) superfamily protein YafD
MPQVDYDRIEWLAGQVSQATTTLDEARVSVDGADITTSSLGNTDGASACRWSYQHLAHNTAIAAERLVLALQSDVDRFALAVATYRDTDRTAANRVLSTGGSLDVFTAHVHSGEGAEDDFVRREQIDRYVDAVAESRGPAVATIDANVSMDAADQSPNDMLAPEELGRFENDLGFSDAARDAGATSSAGRIDHVFTGGIEAGDPERVRTRDDGLSDHDGQAIDLTVPRW